VDETWYWQGTNPNGTSTMDDASMAPYIALSTGDYYLRSRHNTTLCFGESTSIHVVVNGLSDPPVVTAPICSGTNVTISGTSSEPNGTIIEVYLNNVSAGTTTVTGGAWAKTGLNLTGINIASARATATGECQSNLSNIVNITPTTSAPVINSPICLDATNIISGTSSEANGTLIDVYVNNVLTFNDLVVNTGAWMSPSITLAANDVVKANAQAAGKCLSGFSNLVTVLERSAEVLLYSQQCENSTSVSGTCLEFGATITLYINNVPSGTAIVDGGGLWTVSPVTLVYTDVLTATSQIAGKCPSILSNPVSPSQNITPTCPGPQQICDEHAPILITGLATPLGGSYFGTGVTQPETDYYYDPSTAPPGVHTITYTYNNGCINTCQFQMSVHPTPSANGGNYPTACLNGPLVLLNLGSPSGGSYSGVGISTSMGNYYFNPNVGLGAHNFVYHYVEPVHGCFVDVLTTINVVNPPSAPTCPASFSISAASLPLNLTTLIYSPNGGTFSGTGVTGNTFNPGMTGPFVITYTYPPVGCSSSCQFTITVTPACTPPSFTACPMNQSENTEPGFCTAHVFYTATATGTPAPTYSFGFSGATNSSGVGTGSGATFNIGVTNVLVVASNGCNPDAMCTFTVTITDDQPPVLTCFTNQTLTASNCTANYTIADPVDDDCTPPTWGYALSGATMGMATGIANGTNSGPIAFNIGVTTVTLSGTDGINNATPCVRTVTVNAPEINLQGNGMDIANGQSGPPNDTDTDFDGLCISASLTHTFTIQNNGTASLNIPANGITLTGSGAGQFSIGGIGLPVSIGAGNSTTFTVTFTPTSGGPKLATVNIANNDCDENPYTFDVQGIGNEVFGGVLNTIPVICSGGNPDNIGTSQNGSGTGTITYRWEKSVSPFTTWSTIAGEANTTYDPPAPLTQDTRYRRVAISTVGASMCEANSNEITAVVNNVNSGVIAADQTVCFDGDPAPFTSTTDGSGDGVITYQWESSSTGDCTTGFSPMPGYEASQADVPALMTQTGRQFRRVTRSTLNGVTCEAVSNCITVTVNNVDGGTIAGNQTACTPTDPVGFTTLGAASGDGPITYRWESSIVSCNAGFNTIGGATNDTYDPPAGLTQTTYYHRVAISTLNSVACEAVSNCVTVTVNPLPSSSTITETPSTCQPGCIVGGGSFNITPCTGSIMTFYDDMMGTNPTTTAPTYNQTMQMTIYYACVNTTTGCRSAIQTLTTNPGACTNPQAPSIIVNNSTCQPPCAPSGGSFGIITNCGPGSTLTYYSDIIGSNPTTIAPMYNQTMSMTIYYACVNDMTGCRSAIQSLMTNPGTCTNPQPPLVTAMQSTCQPGCMLAGGSFGVINDCGPGTILTYYTDITGTTAIGPPVYNQTTPMTIFYACFDFTTGCRSAIQTYTTTPGTC
ncbi:MAG: choice-of-anchor D domain-containing protein, partial [Saprospiraceae bacterium]